MKDNSFERLEEKIGEAISLIGKLRHENARLQTQRSELNDQLEQLSRSHRQLQEELSSVQSSSVPRDEFESRKQEIERRVASLLERFDELNETGPEGSSA